MGDLGYARALVIGLGRSGVPAVRALLDVGVDVVATDAGPVPDVADDLSALGVEVHTGVDGVDLVPLLGRVDLVIPSPGVREGAPVLVAASERGLPIWSEPELGWRLVPHPLVGITGTNGKTTVTELTASIVDAGGIEAVACGNIGNPFTDAARNTTSDTWLVAELSSFQLRFAHELHPRIGVLLNLAPDHLDWHGGLAAYGAAKSRLWRAQGADDWAVGNLDDEASSELVRHHAPGRVAWFSSRTVPDVGVGVSDGTLHASLPAASGPVVALRDLRVVAPHQIANVAAATTAALLAGTPLDEVADAVRAHRSGRHRFELVTRSDRATWIDDSKATNPHAAAAALRAAGDGRRRVIWIAGGLAKGVDLSVLAEDLGVVRHAVLIGEAAAELASLAERYDVPATVVDSIEEAVDTAASVAEQGDVVLLAPACASFDQFRDYQERGERFAAAARAVRAGGGR